MINRYLFSLDLYGNSENDENNLSFLFSDSFLEVTVFKRVSRIIIDDDENLISLFIIAVAHNTVHKITRFFTIISLFSIKCFQRFRRRSTSIHNVAIVNHSF